MRKLIVILAVILLPLFVKAQTLIERCNFNTGFVYNNVMETSHPDSIGVDATVELYRNGIYPFIIVINNIHKERDTFFISEVYASKTFDTVTAYTYLSKSGDQEYLLTVMYDQKFRCLGLALSNYERMVIFVNREKLLKNL